MIKTRKQFAVEPKLRLMEEKVADRANRLRNMPGYPYLEEEIQSWFDAQATETASAAVGRKLIELTAKVPLKCFNLWARRLMAKQLWSEFGDVPMDPESECIDVDWSIKSGSRSKVTFPAGTFREEIWCWFEETFDVSVATDLMYEPLTPATIKTAV